MTDPVRQIPDVHLTYLAEVLLKLRGPGLVDPELPLDPDNSAFPEGVRDWAHEQIARLVDEKRRRKDETEETRATFDDLVYGVTSGTAVLEDTDGDGSYDES